LLDQFGIRDVCAEDLLGTEDPQVTFKAKSLLARIDAKRPQLLKTLRENPLSLTHADSWEDAIDELKLYIHDSNAEVRREACSALLRVAPAPFSRGCN
jgi:hypothetical protein